MRGRLRARVTAAIVLAALLGAAGSTTAALAASPINGATYKGKLKLARASSIKFPISFKVSPTASA